MQKILMVKVRLLSGDIWAGQASGDQKMFRDTNDIKRFNHYPATDLGGRTMKKKQIITAIVLIFLLATFVDYAGIVNLSYASDGSLEAVADCRKVTPIPGDAEVIKPRANVPEKFARFSGVWNGAWDQRPNILGMCKTLVVEEILPNGYARIINSWDAYGRFRGPGFYRATARIEGDEIRFELPRAEGGGDFIHRLSGGILRGTNWYWHEGTVILTKVDDRSRISYDPRCDPQYAAPPAADRRDRLKAAELLGEKVVPSDLVHNDYFMPLGKSAAALHKFSGVLTVPYLDMFSVRDRCPGLGGALSGFSIAFFTHGDYLVPVTRDSVDSTGGHWQRLLFSPGKVWSEPGDKGMSRASFPFLVTYFPGGAATRNGIATFLYDDKKVSALRFQITQEAFSWSKKDFYGQVAAEYAPGRIEHQERLSAQFEEELKSRVPILPWSKLEKSIGVEKSAAFDGETAPEDISLNGLILDGAIYLRSCRTRTGNFPYCGYMRHHVASVTKSMGAAVTLLRLAQKYGDKVFALKIKDYVDVTAEHDGWEEVTFGDALNMATGIGDNAPTREPPRVAPDANNPKMGISMGALSTKEMLDTAFTFGNYPWGPGEVFRYNNTHTFVLAAAMDSLLKKKEGPKAHIWDMVVNEVLRPIGIFHAPILHTYEEDGGRGVPVLGYGLYPTIDDTAKIATLLQNGGRHNGRQLLSRTKVDEALYRTAKRGLTYGRRNRFGDRSYHMSFWFQPYHAVAGCLVEIPSMRGYGGNFVTLLPNGVSAFRFADGNHRDLEPMVLAGEALRPLCSGNVTDQQPPKPDGKLLGAGVLRTELSGNTLYRHGRYNIYLAPGGVVYGTFTGKLDVGRWRITDSGHICTKWNVWRRRREGCSTVYRNGNSFEFYRTNRWTKSILKRKQGNPEGY